MLNSLLDAHNMRSNYSSGHEAEVRAAEHLKKLGYTVMELNWNNRFAEIDIVARRYRTVYFIESKYRKNSQQGTGLEYITHAKLNQMQRAAEMWVQERGWEGEYTLGAIELTGENYTVTNFIENIL